MDPAVFCHPSRTGDPRVFRFERPENDATKWDRRVESFEKLEVSTLFLLVARPPGELERSELALSSQHFGKSLLRMTLIELVTNHYASLSVPAIEVSLAPAVSWLNSQS